MPKRQQGARVKDLFDLVIRDYRQNGKKSFVSVGFYLLHLEPIFGTMSANRVTAQHIETYKDKRKGEGARNATINRELSILRRGFRLGDINPAPRFVMLSEKDNVRQGFLDLDQVNRIAGALPLSYARIPFFGFYSGWRRGEIIGIQKDWIDLELRLIRMPGTHTKNGKARTLALEGDLFQLVKDQMAEPNNSPFLFPDSKGKQISHSTFSRVWIKACKVVGLPDMLFHDLRRSAVRNLLRAGVSQNIAMKQTGHLTDAILKRYDIVSEDDLREAAQKVSAYLKKRNNGILGKDSNGHQGSGKFHKNGNLSEKSSDITTLDTIDSKPNTVMKCLIYIRNLLKMLLKMTKQRKERDAKESSSPKLLE